MNDKTHPLPPLEEKLETMMNKVRQMPAGGDLEGLLEEQIAELKTLLYEQALEQRKQATASDPAAFHPSGLPELPKPDASKRA